MNTEDFVTYEQALALKKLGFNYDCDYCYSEDKELYKYDYHTEYYNGSNNDLPAPTLAQVQKWLRKEKGIYIEPILIYDKFYTDCKSPSRGKYWAVEHRKYYLSYEDALSAGITECLKLLEKED